MGVLTSKLILSLVDRVTAPARAVAKTMNHLKLAQAANTRQMAAMRGRMMDAAAMGYVLSRALSAPVKSAMAFESAMADVNKVVDFDSPDGLKQMSADILSMSKRIPIAATGIADIVAAAGQAGMKGGELLSFAEMAAKVGVAFDISADQAGESLAKIKTALGLSVEQTIALADAMNHLSNTSASAAPDLLDFMSRVGSIGKQYGFTEQQTVAIGSAMIAAGAKADVAATSFRNVGKALVRGKNATKGQRSAFKELGLDAKIVAKAMQKDAVGTLNDVIARIRKLPKELQAANISALFGDEARAIAPLISNSQLLANSLDSVADKTKYLGSSQKEFEVRSKTSENALQLFKNQMEGLSIAIGSALLPALTKILETVGPVIGAMADWAAAHPNVTAAVVGLAAALVAVNVAAVAMRFAFLFGKGGLLSLATGATSLVGGLMGLLNPLKLVRGAFFALRLAMISTGIGAIVVGIAMAGTWIYNNWSNLSAMFTTFGAAFMRAIKPIMPAIEPVMQAVGWLGDLWNDLTGTVQGGTGQWSLWGAEAGRAVGEIVVSLIELPSKIGQSMSEAAAAVGQTFQTMSASVQTWITDMVARVSNMAGQIAAAFSQLGEKLYQAGVDAMQRLWDGLKAKVQEIITWAASIADKIAAPFRKIGNFVSGIAAKVGIGGGAVPKVAGANAAGGHVAGGSTYLVGELGPELVTPSRAGYVHTAQATKKMAGMQSGANGGSFSFGNIIIQGVQDPEAIAEAIDAKIREKLAGLQADLGYSGA